MKMKMLRSIKAKQAIAGVGLLPLVVAAHASLPETVKTAIDGAKADGMEAGWLVIGVVAALFVFAIVKKLLR